MFHRQQADFLKTHMCDSYVKLKKKYIFAAVVVVGVAIKIE